MAVSQTSFLKNINMTINRGERIALVGYNGAGKTTLVKLIMRLYDPTDGEIRYQNENIMNYNILSTPAIVVDGEVKIKGRVPSEKEIKELLGL